ncbi:hypothetical protein [Lachnospira sp.]|jgi:hypothetical protein|uniref:hypothetical protein n=1 Tax=Lachnospira sp. TaxID=2049031 RepID=UPI00257A30D3|nr:hypothetical protein [Lachnospira sp.]
MDINKNISMPVNVIDITYELNGKTFTDVIGVNDSTFSTKKPGAVTLVATSKDVILKEVKTSLKLDEEFLNSVDKTIERKKNNVE